MTPKKNPKLNLENKRGYFFRLGIITACAITLVAFEWRTPEIKFGNDLPMDEGAIFLEAEIIEPSNVKRPEPKKVEPSAKEQVQKQITDEFQKVDDATDLLKLEQFDWDDLGDIKDIEKYDESDVYESEVELAHLSYANMPYYDECFSTDKEEQHRCTELRIAKELSKHVRYPAICRDANIQGRVFVKFIVDPKGQVSDVELLKGVHPAMDQEALRVVKLLPDLIPGEQRGRKVSVVYKMPIAFRLQ